MRDRQTQDNIRRVLHVIDHITKENTRAVGISLDAEKAFDSVRWEYLYLTLRRFGFKDEFISCINILYSSPNAELGSMVTLLRVLTWKEAAVKAALSALPFLVYLLSP